MRPHQPGIILRPKSKLPILKSVVTVPEASRMWCRHRSTVIRALDDPRIEKRKSAGTWLLRTTSLVRVWGIPLADFDDQIDSLGISRG